MKKKRIIPDVGSLWAAVLISIFLLAAPAIGNGQPQIWEGNQGETIGTSDSRMTITIRETETDVILEVGALGEILADGFTFTLVYNPDALILTDNTFEKVIPLGSNPSDFNSPVISLDAAFKERYTFYTTQVMNHREITGGPGAGMRSLKAAALTSTLNVANVMNTQADEWLPVFNIYFKKSREGTPLETSDVGFFYNKSIPRAFSSWVFRGVSVTHGAASVNDFFYLKPELFLFRSPSMVTTNAPTQIATTSATLNGTFKRGDMTPTDEIIVSAYQSADFTGRLSYDTVSTWGFIYSLEDVEIISNRFSDKITIDGVAYDFPNDAEIAAGTFTRNEKEYFIAHNENSVENQAVEIFKNVTGLIADTTYFVWSVIEYAFETSQLFVKVGNRVEFDTESCIPPAPPIADASQLFCYEATVADLVATVEPGAVLVWFDADGAELSETDLLIDGATYYAKAVIDDNCESETATEVTATILIPQITSSGDICLPGGVAILTFTNSESFAGATFQWMLNGNPIADAIYPVYYATEGGIYTISVTSTTCNGVSAPLTLLEVPGTAPQPELAGDPESFVICGPQGVVTLSIANISEYEAPLTFAWFKNGEIIEGATDATYTATTVGDYQALISEATGCNYFSEEKTIDYQETTIAVPILKADPSSLNVCGGDGVVILSVVNTSAYLYPVYQWYKNGVAIADEANYSIYKAKEAGVYKVKVTDGDCANFSDEIEVTKDNSEIAKPIIAMDPASGVIPVPSMMLLTVENSDEYVGNSVIYVWYHNKDTEVKRSPENFYYTATAGLYFVEVIVDDVCGADSDEVEVTTGTSITPPVIAASSAAPQLCGEEGAVILMLVNIEDYENPTYQWRRNYMSILGANRVNYTALVSGRYELLVFENGGSAASNTIEVVINPSGDIAKPIIASETTTICVGGSAMLTVENTEDYSENVIYNWFNDTKIVQTGASHIYFAETAGLYFVEVLDGYCTAVSDSTTLTESPENIAKPEIAFHPESLNICGENGVVVFTITNTEAYNDPQYQWFKDNVALTENADKSVYFTEEAGVYFVKVTDGACQAFSDSFNVTKTGDDIAAPVLSMMPQNGVIYGENAVRVEVVNTANYSDEAVYIWYKDRETVVQSGMDNVFVSNVEGAYLVQVVDGGCSAYAEFELTAQDAIIATIGESTAICEGGEATLTINIEGGNAPWEVVYTIDGGVTTDTLRNIESVPYQFIVSPATTTTYQLISVTEALGGFNDQLTSSATITVRPKPMVANLTDQIICNKQTTAPVTFTGTGTHYTWENTGTPIQGLPSGVQTGAFGAYQLTNNANEPLVATITVTPYYAESGITCAGDPESFLITVLPTPAVDFVFDQTVCANTTVEAIYFSGVASYFVWNIEPGSANIGSETGGRDYIPSFEAINNTLNTLTATYKVTPVFEVNGFVCEGAAITFSIRVEPKPSIYMIEDQVVCAGGTTLPINIMGTAQNVIYRWTNDKPIIGLQAAGNGNIPAFTAINPTYESIIATVTVRTELLGGDDCEEATTSFTITVLPTANVTNAQNFVFCDGDTFEEFTFAGDTDPAKTTYKWNRTSGAEIGLTLEFGENVIPEFTAENKTSTPLMALYKVTPVFYEYGIACEGTPETFTIVVNPIPAMNPVADQVYCDGHNVPALAFTSDAPDAHYEWEKVSGDVINGLPEFGYGNMPAFTASNEGATPKKAIYKVTASFTGSGATCGDNAQTFEIAVLPRPTVDLITNKDYCKNVSTTAITITGTGTSYQWRLLPGSDNIGSPTGGTNVIPSFTTVNNGATTLTATYEITPIYTYNGYSCPGIPATFNINVHPTPSLSAVANQTVCVGETVQAIHFNGLIMPIGTIVTWTNTNSNIGLPSSGIGDIAAFKAVNTTGAPITATITAIPSYNGCTGASIVFTITVNPIPVMTPIMNQDVCSGETVQIAPFSSNVSSATYMWSFTGGSYIGLSQTSGTGNFPVFVAENNSAQAKSATYSVKAKVGDCVSETVYFTITVYPKPVIYAVTDKVYCPNTEVPSLTFNGNNSNLTFHWTRVSGDAIPGLPPTGVGAMPAFTTRNDSDQPITALYEVVAVFGECSSDPEEFSITVVPSSTVENIPVGAVEYCANKDVDAFEFEGVATQFKWRQTGDDIGLPVTSGTDVIPAFTTVNNGTTPLVATIFVTPIYIYEGVTCNGDVEYSFTITVYPQPEIYNVTDVVYCPDVDQPAYEFVGNYEGLTFSWRRIAGDIIVNLPEVGTGVMPAFTPINPYDYPITAEYEVVAAFGECTSNPISFTITVTPNPTVINIPVNPMAYCSDEEFAAYAFEGTAIQFKWEQTDGDNIGMPASSGYDVIPAFTTVNNGMTILEAVITVTPIYIYEGIPCEGIGKQSFTITVSPTPMLSSETNLGTICSSDFEYIATSNNALATYSWERPAIEGINGGEAGSGTSNVIREYLRNETSEPITVIYQFTLTYNGCSNKEPYQVSVVVNPFADVELSQTTVLCPGTYEYQVTIPAVINNAVEYKIAFNDASILAGFENINYYKPITGDYINFAIPLTGLEAGAYGGTATFRTAQGCESTTMFRFSVIEYATIISQTGDESDKLALCEDDAVVIEVMFNVNRYDRLTYIWYNNDQEVGTGSVGGGQTTITLEVAEPGLYYVVAQGVNCGEELISKKVEVRYNDILIGQKWNNVLYVSNYGGSYIAYQWYKDGYPLGNGDAQYYVVSETNPNAALDIYAEYTVEVTYANGKKLMSCPFTPVMGEPSGVVKIYPNPIQENGTITVELDYAIEEVIGSRIELFDVLGRLILEKVVEGVKTPITMIVAPGTYVVKITKVSGDVHTEKVIVK